MLSLINAGPGTGKTYSLTNGYLLLSEAVFGEIPATEEQQQIFQYLKEEFPKDASVCFFAHSNSAKDTIESRLPKKCKAKVYTFHGAGYSNIIKRYGYQKLSYKRVEGHIQTLTGTRLQDMHYTNKSFWYACKRVLHYLKLEAMEPTESNLGYLIEKYPDLADKTIPDDWKGRIEELFLMGSVPDGEIDYDDMVWLGKKALTRPRFTLGFVDESQDVSRSTYQLVTRMCEHVVFCGDKNQAIMAFAGASEEMYNSIAEKSDAILPLKVTQRCCPMVCRLANAVRPGGVLEGPNKAEGVESRIEMALLPERLSGLVPEQVMVLARTNALVAGTAMMLHRKNIPFQIIDKDFAKEVTDFIRSMFAKDLKGLADRMQKYVSKAESGRSRMWASICKEKVLCVSLLMEEVTSYKDLLALVNEISSSHEGYQLTTIHKAKGLEAKDIFILAPPIEHPLAMLHPISKEQEINLHFTALTRSSHNITWVSA